MRIGDGRSRLLTVVAVVGSGIVAASALPGSVGQAAPATEGAAANGAWESLEPDERARLLHDGVLVREPAFRGGMTFGALIVVARDARPTFEILAQPSRQSCYLPEVARSTTVSSGPGQETVEFEVHKFGTSVYRVRHRFFAERMEIDWSLDPSFSNDLRSLSGYFTVRPLGAGHALIEYGTAIDVSRWVPDWLQRRAMRTDVPAALDRLRRFVDAGGHCGGASHR